MTLAYYPIYTFDEEHMILSLNFGSGGVKQCGMGKLLSNTHSNDHSNPKSNNYVLRYSYFYKWYGHNRKNAIDSLEEYGIAVRCKCLDLMEYECMMRTWECEWDEYIIFTITESELEERLINYPNVHEFTWKTGVYLSDFKRMEIDDKLIAIKSYYDILDFINDYEFIAKDDAKRLITKVVRRITDSQYDWTVLTVTQREKYIDNKIHLINNTELHLMFINHNVTYTMPRYDFVFSYTVHSEFSVIVFLNIEIIYNNGKSEILEPQQAIVSGDSFEFFEGKVRIRSNKGYIWDVNKINMFLSIE